MTDQEFMKFAIIEAEKARAAGKTPLGVVIVKDNQILVSGTSHVGDRMDPTAHGETDCMKLACQKLNSLDLSDCTLYSTLEPCSMCLGCAGWTGLSKIVFGAYKEDAPGNPYEMSEYHAEEWSKYFASNGQKGIDVRGGVLRSECAELMKHVKNWMLES